MSLPRRRGDTAGWQSSSVDVSQPSTGSNVNPFNFTTRNVSWDPVITVVEPADYSTPRPQPRPADAPSSSSHRGRAEPQRSMLHPLLSPESPNVVFDVRLAPAPSITTSGTTTPHSIAEPAIAGGARHLRLVSREFPWTIDVENPRQTAVTCADVFSALYAGLSITITQSEWTLADDHKRQSIQRANQTRRGGGNVKRLRRIDWLGSRVYFKGLTRDDVLCRSRLLPEEELKPETWVVKFGSRN